MSLKVVDMEYTATKAGVSEHGDAVSEAFSMVLGVPGANAAFFTALAELLYAHVDAMEAGSESDRLKSDWEVARKERELRTAASSA